MSLPKLHRKPLSPASARALWARPSLEALEDRLTPAATAIQNAAAGTLTVSVDPATNNDDLVITLANNGGSLKVTSTAAFTGGNIGTGATDFTADPGIKVILLQSNDPNNFFDLTVNDLTGITNLKTVNYIGSQISDLVNLTANNNPNIYFKADLQDGPGDAISLAPQGVNVVAFSDALNTSTTLITPSATNSKSALYFRDVTSDVFVDLTVIAPPADTRILATYANMEVRLTANTNAGKFSAVYGGSGNDTLIGNALDNWLVGGLGTDTLIGNGGNDELAATRDFAPAIDGTVTNGVADSSNPLTVIDLSKFPTAAAQVAADPKTTPTLSALYGSLGYFNFGDGGSFVSTGQVNLAQDFAVSTTVTVLAPSSDTLLGGDGNDGIQGFNLANITALGQSGDDALLVPLSSTSFVDGGPGANTLNVIEPATLVSDSLSLSGSQITSAQTGGSISYAATGGSLALNLTTTSGADNVTVFGTAANVSTSIETGGGNDSVTAVLPSSFDLDAGSGVNSLTVTGAASDSPDVLTVDVGLVSSITTGAFITYSATGGSFSDLSVFTGTAADSVSVLGTDPATTTTIDTGDGDDSITVSLPAVVTVEGGAGNNTLTATEAGSSTPDSIDLDLGFISSAVTGSLINYLATGGAFTSINLFTGDAADSVNVFATAAGSVTSVQTGGGDDTIIVILSDGTTTPLAGVVDVDAGTGTNTLSVDGSTGTFVEGAIVTADTIFSNVTGATVTYAATGGDFNGGVFVSTGTAADFVAIMGTAANAPVNILTNDGGDAIFIQPVGSGDATTVASAINIEAGSGVNAIQLNLTNSVSAEGIVSTADTIFSPTRGYAIFYAATGGTFFGIGLLTGSGNDVIFVQAPPADGGSVFAFTNDGADAIYATPLGQIGVNAGTGDNALVVTDSGLTVADTLVMFDSSISGIGGTVFYGATGGTFNAGIAVIGSEANDNIVLNSTLAGIATYLLGQGGNDVFTVNVSTASNYTAVFVDGNAGTNTLNVADVSGGGVVQKIPSSTTSGTVTVSYASVLDSIIFYANVFAVTNGVTIL